MAKWLKIQGILKWRGVGSQGHLMLFFHSQTKEEGKALLRQISRQRAVGNDQVTMEPAMLTGERPQSILASQQSSTPVLRLAPMNLAFTPEWWGRWLLWMRKLVIRYSSVWMWQLENVIATAVRCILHWQSNDYLVPLPFSVGTRGWHISELLYKNCSLQKERKCLLSLDYRLLEGILFATCVLSHNETELDTIKRVAWHNHSPVLGNRCRILVHWANRFQNL